MQRRFIIGQKVHPIYEDADADADEETDETGDVEAGDSEEDDDVSEAEAGGSSEEDENSPTTIGMPAATVADNAALSSMTKLTLDLMANRNVYHQYLGAYEPDKMARIRRENAEVVEHRGLILETAKACLNKIAGRGDGPGPNADLMDAFAKFAKRVILEHEYEKNNGASDQLLGDCLEGENISSRVWGGRR